MDDLERLFKALGQKTRLKIIKLLTTNELCVCEIEEILGISQSAVSQHLRILKNASLLNEERRGQWVFYSLKKERIDSLMGDFLQFLNVDISQLSEMENEVKIIQNLIEEPKTQCSSLKKV